MEKLNKDEISVIKIMLLDRVKVLNEEIEKIQCFYSQRILENREYSYYLDLCSDLDKKLREYMNIYNKLDKER